ncbi:hypothetical protein [Streptomyces sp. 8L]|uniref:hypothetical protein n=1 Tax=Streptomyces sp. 8L TaxID=2877242 RepID=UPI001CD4D529|nr:hypothetical protein [Streptomyces sp. 8L]MCA1220251.1 hypothetical protein [Streptomyces sp. 8L]
MISRLPVTMALHGLLTSATGLPVGRGTMPARATPPYYVLYSLDTHTSGAPYSDLNEDASFVYQLTSVSGPNPAAGIPAGLEDQTEWLADNARAAILGRDPTTGLWLHALTIPGARVICRDLDIEAGGTSDPADGIMSYVQRFRFDLTSA